MVRYARPNCKRIHEGLVNTCGSFTLTTYNPEPSDVSFTERNDHLGRAIVRKIA